MPEFKPIYGAIVIGISLLIFLQLVTANPISTDENMRSRKVKRSTSFNDLKCKGIYDKQIFASVDQICDDCYNLFREPKLHLKCRENCFTTQFFKGCIDVLLLNDEIDKIQQWIHSLNGLGIS